MDDLIWGVQGEEFGVLPLPPVETSFRETIEKMIR